MGRNSARLLFIKTAERQEVPQAASHCSLRHFSTVNTGKKTCISGLLWLENVNVFEISQHVNITLQGNYCKIISMCLYLLQLHTEVGLRG